MKNEIIKRDGSQQSFEKEKIQKAMAKAFLSIDQQDHQNEIQLMADEIAQSLENGENITVEVIQDHVEETLMRHGFYQVAKNYIRYRAEHEKNRERLARFQEDLRNQEVIKCLKNIGARYTETEYSLDLLYAKFKTFLSDEMTSSEREQQLIRAAVELTSQEAPKWEYIASQLMSRRLQENIDDLWAKTSVKTWIQKLEHLTRENLLGEYILENYSKEEVEVLSQYMKPARDLLLNHSGLDLLMKRYLIRNREGIILEKPQEMFMGIAMHLAIPEGNHRVEWAKKIYDIISKLQVTVATPTMSNARKPFHQLSSCFIDTVPDSLDGIYQSISNFAQVSKYGGGMGLYFGKVRAAGSDIRGFQGAAGGVIRWIKLANDTAVAVDQLGVRQGAVAVYLDAWHKDLPEFLQIRTNNGDDRMKAHDVFPGVCYPDYFWELADTNMDADWYLMCPHEILKVKGFSLEDYYGDEWKRRYLACVEDGNISKRVVKIKDLVRLILRSVIETGTPFAFNRDLVNKMNPNHHKGMIYCSNLCTEIAQNMSAIQDIQTSVVQDGNGDDIVVTKNKAGDFVVCNLASLVLGNIDVSSQEELRDIVHTAIRALDNVIDLNFYPTPYAQITNQKYRSIGLGISGWHHMLAKNHIKWESDEHLTFADGVMENINYYAVEASNELAKEKGSYSFFEGSDWQNGEYFTKRLYNTARWDQLKKSVRENGLRNGYLLAIAPTSSTSIIAGTTASVDPIMNRYFLEEKKGAILPRVAPELTSETAWYYKNAHSIDQSWVVRAGGIRQRHIDQAQSLNLYITTEFTMRQLLNLYIEAWKNGVKTIYYVRSKSLEVEDCEVCSA